MGEDPLPPPNCGGNYCALFALKKRGGTQGRQQIHVDLSFSQDGMLACNPTGGCAACTPTPSERAVSSPVGKQFWSLQAAWRETSGQL